MCEYTSHGHCGILEGDQIANDPTLHRLASVAVSHARERELDEALEQVEKESAVNVVYLVDSFGALYSEQIFHHF